MEMDGIEDIRKAATVCNEMYVTIPRHVRSSVTACKSSYHFELLGFRQNGFELHRRIEHPLRLKEPGTIASKGLHTYRTLQYQYSTILGTV